MLGGGNIVDAMNGLIKRLARLAIEAQRVTPFSAWEIDFEYLQNDNGPGEGNWHFTRVTYEDKLKRSKAKGDYRGGVYRYVLTYVGAKDVVRRGLGCVTFKV